MEILIFLFFSISCFLFYLYYKEKNKNKKIEKINLEIQQENEKIYNENENLLEKQKIINQQYNQKHKELKDIQETITKAENISRKAFENYNNILDSEYKSTEKEYEKSINLLKESYNKKQDEVCAEMAAIQTDLDKISATRAAAIQAQLKEEEIQQQEQFYSLSISDIDKREIKILQSIESELRDPRPIRMIIWQTYYSKKANELASRVLGPEEVCGIYKITNKNNKMCYIGQAKKVRERFRDHMKCGLGIDTPANNKLYQAMLKEGLSTFTFELIESCSVENLDEKEYFYINLYNSYHFGYNSNTGIKKP